MKEYLYTCSRRVSCSLHSAVERLGSGFDCILWLNTVSGRVLITSAAPKPDDVVLFGRSEELPFVMADGQG